MGLIGLNQGWPSPKEQGVVRVARNYPHHNATKRNDLPVHCHPLLQMKVVTHLTLHLPHLCRPLQTTSAIIPHRQRTKDSRENMPNADMPILRMWRKGHQNFRTTNMADITINGKDSTDPESYHGPHHHPALALRTTPLTTRAHVTCPRHARLPAAHSIPAIPKNSWSKSAVVSMWILTF